MRLNEPLLRLPITFDATELAAEIAALPPQAWVAHPNNHPGNAAVRLVTTNGQQVDDTTAPMAPTEYFRACPYIREVMAAIGATWGRSRLMRLSPGAVVPPHIDTNFYWRTHIRIHVPITTNPGVLFTCAGNTVHMAAGECWVFDTFDNHQVCNRGTETRVHLVLDTVGGEGLWDLIEAARSGQAPVRRVVPGSGNAAPLAFERLDASTTMSPWELRQHVGFIGERAMPAPLLAPLMKRLDRFVAGWAAVWAEHGAAPSGSPSYRQLIAALEADLGRIGGQQLRLRNGLPVYRQITELVFVLNAALAPAQDLRSVA